MRGRIGRSRVWKKRGFSVLDKNNLLCFFGTFSSFQPSLGVSHDLGSHFILYATDKTFPEEDMCHALCVESKVLKGSYKVFHFAKLFQLGQMNSGCLYQSVCKALQQTWSKQHTLGVHFSAIATIASVQYPNREQHNEF
jgi:hypothetical protein